LAATLSQKRSLELRRILYVPNSINQFDKFHSRFVLNKQAKTLEVDMAFVLEGKEIEFLPEHVLGAVRLLNVDFKVQDGQRVVLPF